MAKRAKRQNKRGTSLPVPKAAPEPSIARRPPAPIARQSFPWLPIVQALIIVAVGIWIYWPSLHGLWLWDDDYLIQNNREIHDPTGLWYIWFDPKTLIDYFPLTVSVEWLIWQIWPNDTFYYHAPSLALHLLNALLVWVLFRKLGLRLAWLGGLIFAIHPVLVESVAWMAELKNTLAMPPFLLAMCAWIDFDRRHKSEDYIICVLLFLTAMLCKTSMMMFPFIILLHAWWRRGKVGWADIVQTIPFFVISLAIGIALLTFLRHGVGEEFTPLGGFWSRMACGGLSIAFYFSKCVLPLQLLPIYPQWVVNPPNVLEFLPWPVMAFTLWWLWKRRNGWGRHALFGLGFFLINILPFSGFRMISFMRFTWVMDHLLYVPILGLLGLAIAAMGHVDELMSASTRLWRLALVAVICTLMAFSSHRYAKIYQSTITLWSYEAKQYPSAWPARNNLGNALIDAGRYEEAKVQILAALQLNPRYTEAHNNLGFILVKEGNPRAAIEEFQEALRYTPDFASAQNNVKWAAQALHIPPPPPPTPYPR